MAVTLSVKIDLSQLKGLELQTRRALDRSMDKSLDYVTERALVYPPVRPSSRYRRTGDHRRGVEKKKFSFRRGMVVWTDNSSRTGRRYAQWVRGHRTQARVHRGRWPTDKDIAREARQKVKQIYNGEFRRVGR